MGTKYSLGFRESINSGADLNNYKTIGSYASKSNSNIIKNSPASAFSLDVEYSLGGGGDYIRQTLKPYSYEGKYYVRYRGYTGVWSEWLTFVLSSDLPQWLNFTDEFGSSWITGMLQSLLQAENYKNFEYSNGVSHEGGVVIFKLRNDYYCSGIFIPGTEYANSKRIFIINGIPNVLTSWKYKEII